MSRTVLVLPGDGVGPEVAAEAVRVLERLALGLVFQHGLVGGAALDAQGSPLGEEVLAAARAADAILFGAVGGPRWETAPFALRPEAAILRLRGELGLYANLRPARIFEGLEGASCLKDDRVRGLDLVIVRESVGGIYFGSPRGVETLPDGRRRGFNTESYATDEVERVAATAFELARGRRGRVVSVEKSNVMESGLVWRETVEALGRRAFPDVALSHMYADNCAMQLARDPRQFDVILTTNLFGDILSDLASMLTGGIGLLPSATLGAVGDRGRRAALYEPIHGSAPDIAGRGIANPVAEILSAALMLKWSFGLDAEADALERACARALREGVRTPDLGGRASTREMGDAVLRALEAEYA